jgi:hypothetical protein
MTALSALALMMAGQPPAALAALPFVPLLRFLPVRKAVCLASIPCALVTAGRAVIRFAPLPSFAGLEKTPLWVIAGVTVGVAAALASGGIDSLRKWGNAALPFAGAFLLLSALVLMKQFEPTSYIPPLSIEPVFLACGAVTLLGLVTALEEVRIRVYLAVLGIAAAFSGWCLALTSFTLGDGAAGAAYPFLKTLRVARGGELIGRVETLLIPVSFALTVGKIAGCFVVLCYSYRWLTDVKRSRT